MLRQYDAFLSVGRMAEEYLRSFGVAEPLIARSPHCVDNARFEEQAARARMSGKRTRERGAIGARAGDFVVFFAGKLQPRKRPVDAVRAVARLGPDAVLMIAGDGPLADDCRVEAARLGVRLAWRGFLNQSELPAAFAASDCLLVPSAWESWGLIVNEALASGIPCVVTTRVACAPDLIEDGVTGYAVAPGDVDAMAARLADVRASLASGHDFSGACTSRVARCSFTAATDGLVAASRRVVARRRVPEAARAGAPRVVAVCGGMVSVFGLERIAFEVLRALSERGARVHCIVNRWSSSPIVGLAEDIGATWSTGSYEGPLKRRGWTPRQLIAAAWDIARTSAGFLRDVARLRATHVFLPDFAAVLRNLPALLLVRAYGVSVVLKVGNAPETHRFYRRMWKWAIRPLVTTFVANSRFTADALAATGVPGRKIRMIYNTPPTRRESSPPVAGRDPNRIVYVGQMIPPKGIDLLLEAVAVLAGRGYDVRLDAVGDIDGWEPPVWQGFRQRLRARAERPDLRGRVRFLGVREDVPAVLAAAGVHCCPSLPEIREAFGLVTVEAKAAGIPSVVLPSGALPELVEHRRDGWVCEAATVEALVEGLAYFLDDPSRSADAGRHARASQERFSRERFASAWLGIFGVTSTDSSAQAEASPSCILEGHVR
jgi:glycosyltransferase involved in cell wall biosynthesis